MCPARPPAARTTCPASPAARVRDGQSCRERKPTGVTRAGGGGVTARGAGSPRGEENVLELDRGRSCNNAVTVLSVTELVTQQR